jgi:hypothetical protein
MRKTEKKSAKVVPDKTLAGVQGIFYNMSHFSWAGRKIEYTDTVRHQ